MNRSILRGICLAATVALLTTCSAASAQTNRSSVPTRRVYPSAFDQAFRTAVDEGDLPRLKKLLTGHRPTVNFAAYAQNLAEREGAIYCGNDGNRPRVPWTRARFLPVFQFLVREGVGIRQTPGLRRHETLLIAAVQLGDLQSVRYLIERGADVNTRLPVVMQDRGTQGKVPWGGETPLLLAAGYIDTEQSFAKEGSYVPLPDPDPVAAYLLQHGADVCRASGYGDTPLIAASRRGKVGTTRLLLAAGANPAARDHAKRSALTVAQSFQWGKNRDALIALLGPVTPRDLFEASGENDATQIQKLLREGADPNAARPNSRETALMAAAKRNAANAATALLDGGATVTPANRSGKNALHVAAEAGSDAVVALLLDRGAAPNTEARRNGVPATGLSAGQTPLVLAIRNGHINTALLLLKRGAKPGVPGRQGTVAKTLAYGGIRNAKIADRKRLLEALVAAGLDLRTSPTTAFAAGSRDPVWLRAVLDAGGNPNAHIIGEGPRDNESTALTMAISEHLMAKADYGGEQNARPNTPNALRFKTQVAGARQCFDLLLDRGANVNETKRTGSTAFMYAASVSAFDLADELLKRGAKRDAADENGRTALHRTVSDSYFADERALRYLLKRGANRTLRDKNSDTALALAKKHIHAKAIALLTRRN